MLIGGNAELWGMQRIHDRTSFEIQCCAGGTATRRWIHVLGIK